MATATVKVAHHAALVAATVDTITLSNVSTTGNMIARSGSAEVYFTVGTTAAPPAAPTVGGDDCYLLPATAGAIVSFQGPSPAGGSPLVVKLISSGTPTYSVQGSR